MNYFNTTKQDGFIGEHMIVLPTEVFTHYAKHPLVKRMYLTDVGFFPHAKHHYRERKDGIEEYIYLYCTQGEGTIWIGDTKINLKAHQAVCIPPFKSHRYYACQENPWSILWVHFKGEDTSLYPLDSCNLVCFESDFATNRMLFLFDLLFRVLDANYTQGNFVYIAQVLQLILTETYFREKKNTTEEQNKYVTHIIRYFYDHLNSNLTLDTLSTEFELSKSYINAIFQKHTQHTPIEFFLNLKMKEACNRLRASNIPIYQIAKDLGYDDPYYFSRLFKRVIGTSPKNYRNSPYLHYK